MYMALFLALVLTCSYKLVEIILAKLAPGKAVYSIYLWAAGIFIVIPFVKTNYIFHLPKGIVNVLPACLLLAVVIFFMSRFSGYHPIGRFNTINFIFVWPIMEEIVFRGMVLPILNEHITNSAVFEFMYLSVSLPVMITALLFAVCHLQYYKLSRQSAIYMGFAFVGGLVFGSIAEATQSILLGLLLHMEFNFFAFFFGKKRKRHGIPSREA